MMVMIRFPLDNDCSLGIVSMLLLVAVVLSYCETFRIRKSTNVTLVQVKFLAC